MSSFLVSCGLKETTHENYESAKRTADTAAKESNKTAYIYMAIEKVEVQTIATKLFEINFPVVESSEQLNTKEIVTHVSTEKTADSKPTAPAGDKPKKQNDLQIAKDQEKAGKTAEKKLQEKQPASLPVSEVVKIEDSQLSTGTDTEPNKKLKDALELLATVEDFNDLANVTDFYKDLYLKNEQFIRAVEAKRNVLEVNLYDEYRDAINTAVSPQEIEQLSNSDKYKNLAQSNLGEQFLRYTRDTIHSLQVYAAVSELKMSGSKEHLDQLIKKYPKDIQADTRFQEQVVIRNNYYNQPADIDNSLNAIDPNDLELNTIYGTAPQNLKETAVKVWNTFKGQDNIQMLEQMKNKWKETHPHLSDEKFLADLYFKRAREIKKP